MCSEEAKCFTSQPRLSEHFLRAQAWVQRFTQYNTMTKNQAQKIFQKLQAAIPNPKTELHYHTNFELLVAVLLSARTTDVSVNKVTAKLFSVANTPAKMLQLGTIKLKRMIRPLGFYNAKSANLMKTCRILQNQFHSQIPATREQLQLLPGVGRKTANVILNVAFDQPTIAVDTHVFRVANRTGLASGKTPEEVEEQLEKIISPQFKKIAHYLLLLHGRYTCKSQKPLCASCPINTLCQFYLSLQTSPSPATRKKRGIIFNETPLQR